MAGTKALLQVAPDSTGKKVEARQLPDGSGNDVLRQVIVLGDPESVDNTLVVNDDGSINTTIVKGTSVDGSTSITAGGTAQLLFGGVTPAQGFAIYNPDPSNDLWVSDSGNAAPNAAGSIRVVANGGGYETPQCYRPVGAVTVYGAVTGQKITAKRW